MNAGLFVLELLFVAALLVGVGMWSIPAALVLGGVLGVVAVERAQTSRKGASP